jgi:hypothetical protein
MIDGANAAERRQRSGGGRGKENRQLGLDGTGASFFIEEDVLVSISSRREATWRQLHHAVHEEEKSQGGLLGWAGVREPAGPCLGLAGWSLPHFFFIKTISVFLIFLFYF